MLTEWFPGREHFKLINDVLLVEALLVIVQAINGVSAEAARAFIEQRLWLTTLERDALM